MKLAIILPPVAVLVHSGCGSAFLINILLTCLAWLPGLIHAMYVIFKDPPASKNQQQQYPPSASIQPQPLPPQQVQQQQQQGVYN